MDFISNKLEISYDQGRFWVKCHILANKFNKILNYYDQGKYTFKYGEEATMCFKNASQMQLNALSQAYSGFKLMQIKKAG